MRDSWKKGKQGQGVPILGGKLPLKGKEPICYSRLFTQCPSFESSYWEDLQLECDRKEGNDLERPNPDVRVRSIANGIFRQRA